MTIPRLTPAVVIPRRTTGETFSSVSFVSHLGWVQTHLRGVQGTDGQVEAQPNSQDQLADKECSPGRGKDLSEDASARDQDSNGQGRPPTNTVRHDAAEKAPKELSHRGNRVEGTQPGRRNYEAISIFLAKVSSERGDGKHRAVDLGIKSPKET